MSATRKLTAELLLDGHEILPALLRDLRDAQRSIHISVFLWFRDPIGEQIADLLIERARQGVHCRVLLNIDKTGMGDPFSTGERKMMKHDPTVEHDPLDVKPMCERMTAAGVEVVNTNIDYDKIAAALSPRLRSVAAQINGAIDIDELHIDHRKLVLIDGAVAYCGGANIGAQYLYQAPFDATKDAQEEGRERLEAGLSEPWWKWHDSWTRFEGEILADFERFFHERFLLDGGTDYRLEPALPSAFAARPGSFPIARAQCFANQPDDRPNDVLALYVQCIADAERSIFIENPYFYHSQLVQALCSALERRPTLDVTLVLPAGKWNDNSFAHDAQQHEYQRLLAAGARIFEYQNHFNHLKIAVFDERYSIHGSTNGNYRSLERDKDFELVVLVDDQPFARHILQRVRDVDVQRARPVTLEDLRDGTRGLRIRYRDPRTLLLLSRCSL